ncbi:MULTISPECIES: hypothetical protein [unclassified Bartonella]|uniref:hypothetical protein n=1 Tax=unclassified Bartonella TaxID=2645622 RepID=UPI0035CFA124
MIKVFKNYMLNIFMAIAFFLSQVVNVNANHLSNNLQREDAFVISQVKEKVTHIASLYVPNLSYGAKNGTTVEGRVEKIAQPVIIGDFGLSFLIGYLAPLVGFIIAAIINHIKRHR